MRSPPPACQPCEAHVCIFPVGRCGLSIYGLTVQFDQKAHLISYVVVHARVDQCRIALTDVDTTTLSESEHISTKGLVDSSKDKHTHLARLAYTLMLASVAVPSMESPPPTCVKRSKHCVPAGGTGNYSWNERLHTFPAAMFSYTLIDSKIATPREDTRRPPPPCARNKVSVGRFHFIQSCMHFIQSCMHLIKCQGQFKG